MRFLNKVIKKEKVLPTFSDSDIVAPVSGKMIPASEISDVVFSQELMGQTIGIIPSEGMVVCPVNGTVSTIFPTGHAFGITDSEGNGYLVHIGIDTVSMEGNGFKTFLKEGQTVKAGQKAVEIDLDKIKKSGYETTTMLIVVEKAREDYRVNYIDFGNVEKAQKINQ